MLGPQVDWTVTDYLLARVAHLLAGANWQRGGGKGAKPRPLKVPDGSQSRQARRARSRDTVRRLRNLGLLPGHAKPPPRPLTPQEQAIAAAIERTQATKGQPADQ